MFLPQTPLLFICTHLFSGEKKCSTIRMFEIILLRVNFLRFPVQIFPRISLLVQHTKCCRTTRFFKNAYELQYFTGFLFASLSSAHPSPSSWICWYSRRGFQDRTAEVPFLGTICQVHALQHYLKNYDMYKSWECFHIRHLN